MSSNQTTLRQIRSFDGLLVYLEHELDWPIAEMSIDDLTFEYDPSGDLGLSQHTAAQVRRVLQLRSLTVEQPFGIFFVEFDSRYLPIGIMRQVLKALVRRRRDWLNPVQRKTWAQEDLLFVSASGDDGHRRIDFAHFEDRPNRTTPVIRVLGWHPAEPIAKLDWVETQLRRNLCWPRDQDDASWRSRWIRAFEHRLPKDRGAWTTLDQERRQTLINVYAASELTVDALPYTPDFDWMHDAFNRTTGLDLTQHDFWRALSSARKTGALPRKER